MNLILKSNANVYEQIVEHYKKYIDLKIYLSGEKLPSCRVLAKELGINPNTVDRAYSVLEKEGYIKSIPKKGFYVADLQQNDYLKSVQKQIVNFKNQNVNYDDLIKIINFVYKGDE